MQFAPILSRAELIDLTTKRLFGALDAKDLDGAVACFQASAMLCVQTGFGNFAGREAIKAVFENFFDRFETIAHREFVPTVDDLNGRITVCLTCDLTAPDGTVLRETNTNFFRIRDGLIQDHYIYTSGQDCLIPTA